MSLRLTSSALTDGQPIPVRHSCDGEDLSPPLAWSGAPPGTRSFALLCDDPDAPAGTWHHWAAFDIPADLTQLAEGVARRSERCARRSTTSVAYGGPCPPRGHGRHHYRFRLLALQVVSLGLPGRVRCVAVARAAGAHVLASAELVGTFSR